MLQPRYIGEIAPASVRGLLSSSMQLSLCIGILVAYLFGIPYEHDDGAFISIGGWEVAWWRVVLFLGTLGSANQVWKSSILPGTHLNLHSLITASCHRANMFTDEIVRSWLYLPRVWRAHFGSAPAES